MSLAALFLAACGTALATGIGSIAVYAVRDRTPRISAILWGVACGVMLVAAVQGMLLPGLQQAADAGVWAGVVAGVALLLVIRSRLGESERHFGSLVGANARTGILVFGVLLIHSLPEGMALGAAWATGETSLGLFVFVAIALQNIPEGTAAAIPLRDAGIPPGKGIAAATATGLPQPVGALASYVLINSIGWLLGPSFGFAAGAMLALLVPRSYRRCCRSATPGHRSPQRSPQGS